MSRSIWKGPYINKINQEFKDGILVCSGRSTIMPDLVGKKVYIHNGKSYKLLEITSQIIGYKFGEFAFTKLPARYKKAAVNVKTKKR